MRETGLPESHVKLGMVELEQKLRPEKLKELKEKLDSRGFELIFDRETELVNLVKSTIIQYLSHIETAEYPERLSDFVTKNTNYNYSYLSKMFSDKKGGVRRLRSKEGCGVRWTGRRSTPSQC